MIDHCVYKKKYVAPVRTYVYVYLGLASVFSSTSVLTTNIVSTIDSCTCSFTNVFEAKRELSSAGAVIVCRGKHGTVTGDEYSILQMTCASCG